MRYTVTAERGATPTWVFQCVEYPGAISESKRLIDGETLMVETIAFVAGVDPAEVEIDLVPVIDAGIAGLIAESRRLRAEAEELQHLAAEGIRKAAYSLAGEHLTVRDIGTILGVSHQRAVQLINS